ncbi:MAG TPA: ABC transporter substrate-binding protein [Acidimicrobiales bacterium]|nr:ABC transporter substrate-binding protein [Acidimicrobiales bacterium]
MRTPSRIITLLSAAAGVAAMTAGVATPVTAAAASTTHAAATSPVTLVMDNESGETWPCGFNPFSSAVNADGLSFGEVYEELVFVDSLESGKATPWLATAYKWSNSGKTLTFTIRQGVKWSDGQPFSAKDVLFTFDLLKKYPALDLTSVWSVLSSVAPDGTDGVVFNFKTVATPYFYYIADQVPIVPEHIWAKIANPVNYIDTNPVGTGPYVMQKCTPENIVYQRNPLYWQKGLPRIQTVDYPSFTSNDPANQELSNGTAQWGSQYVPNIQASYLSKSRDYHDWFPPIASVSLFPNLTNKVLQNVAVREAIAYAINRPLVSKIGESGYEPAGNQTDIATPTFSAWLDQGLANQYGYSYSPAKAMSVLAKAGFKEVGGVMQKGDEKLSFSVINVGGFSDWVADMLVIQQELKAVGIQVTPENLSETTYFTRLYDGQFQIAYGDETGGPSPYYEMRQILYSHNTAPVGQAASTNYERYSNAATDSLIDQYAGTTSLASQHAITNALEKVMLSQVPVVPVVEEVDWYQYDTAHIAGWATPTDAYAQPAIYITPDVGVMLLHLYPTS